MAVLYFKITLHDKNGGREGREEGKGECVFFFILI